MSSKSLNPTSCPVLYLQVTNVASRSEEEEEDSDPRAVDALLSELVLLLSRSSLYFRFLKKHIEVR